MNFLSCGGWGRWIYGSCAATLGAATCLSLAPPPAVGSAADTRQGGVAQLAFVGPDLDSLDFLNFVLEIDNRTGLQSSESDSPTLTPLTGGVASLRGPRSPA